MYDVYTLLHAFPDGGRILRYVRIENAAMRYYMHANAHTHSPYGCKLASVVQCTQQETMSMNTSVSYVSYLLAPAGAHLVRIHTCTRNHARSTVAMGSYEDRVGAFP